MSTVTPAPVHQNITNSMVNVTVPIIRSSSSATRQQQSGVEDRGQNTAWGRKLKIVPRLHHRVQSSVSGKYPFPADFSRNAKHTRSTAGYVRHSMTFPRQRAKMPEHRRGWSLKNSAKETHGSRWCYENGPFLKCLQLIGIFRNRVFCSVSPVSHRTMVELGAADT